MKSKSKTSDLRQQRLTTTFYSFFKETIPHRRTVVSSSRCVSIQTTLSMSSSAPLRLY